MPVASMTGFARVEGEAEDVAFTWEIRSVNGKGLDIRLRLPQGYESAESDLRKLAGARFSRGNLQMSLSLRRAGEMPAFAVNERMLAEVLALSDRLIAGGHAVTPTADGILSLKGIIEPAQDVANPEDEAPRRHLVLEAFHRALDALEASRWEEGAALQAILTERLSEIEALIARAQADPSRTPDAIRARLASQVADLLGTSPLRLDEARLHQEVALIATKADIREEIDRLSTHVAAAGRLLADGGPIGRRLDFLSQEFNRESNTICSKSNSADLTAIGLDLKVVVDQFREQVQNIE